MATNRLALLLLHQGRRKEQDYKKRAERTFKREYFCLFVSGFFTFSNLFSNLVWVFFFFSVLFCFVLFLFYWIFSLLTFQMLYLLRNPPIPSPLPCLYEGAPPAILPPTHSCLPTLEFPYTGASNPPQTPRAAPLTDVQ